MKTKKILALALAAVLLVAVSVAGTVAYLVDKTQEVSNTFTVTTVDIKLTETTGDSYEMIPGKDLPKNPTVTVIGGSEKCYVFVKYVYTEKLYTEYLTYEIDDAWNELASATTETTDEATGVTLITKVLWQEIDAENSGDVTLPLLDGNHVVVREDVTNSMMAAANYWNLTMDFTAYAIQSEGFANADAAWESAKNLDDTAKYGQQ